MESAPKDGTDILLCGPAYDDASRGPYIAVGCWLHGAWRDDPDDTEGWELNGPTHWQPLPDPPAALALTAGETE